MRNSLIRVTRVIRNAFASPGRGLFGGQFTLGYLRLIASSALGRLAMSDGRLSCLGYDIAYPNASHAVFLVHEVFVNASYDFAAESATPLIVDAGANIGMATLFFKKRYPEARVIAVEPDARTFRTLSANVTENSLNGVTLVNAALTESGAPITFYTDAGGGGITSSIYAAWGGATAQTVPGTRLSDLIDGPVDLLKMDIEGGEYGVMRDLDVTGKWSLIRRIILEYHPVDGLASGQKVVRDALVDAGFTIVRDIPAGAPGTGIMHAVRQGATFGSAGS